MGEVIFFLDPSQQEKLRRGFVAGQTQRDFFFFPSKQPADVFILLRANSRLISIWMFSFSFIQFCFSCLCTRPEKSSFLSSIWEILLLLRLSPTSWEEQRDQKIRFIFQFISVFPSFILTFSFFLSTMILFHQPLCARSFIICPNPLPETCISSHNHSLFTWCYTGQLEI